MQLLHWKLSRISGKMYHLLGWALIPAEVGGKAFCAPTHAWLPCKPLAMFDRGLQIFPSSVFNINPIILNCRTLASMGLKGSLSGDIQSLSELQILYVFSLHCNLSFFNVMNRIQSSKLQVMCLNYCFSF